MIGVFFGSDTGNTKTIATIIKNELDAHNSASFVQDIAKSSKADLEKCSLLLMGVPTWNYGELQCDWDDFLPTLQEIDFKGKKVGLFGCGDQLDYSQYFCDAMGKIRDVIQSRGAQIIGRWPVTGYHFSASKGLSDINHFVGLAIDEDRQPELTPNRVATWVNQILKETNLY